MKSTEILKQLISIPSWVDSKTNELKVGLWIYNYLKKNTDFTLKKQYIGKDRFNIIATKGVPRLWLAGHMDTVEIFNKTQIVPKIKDGKIYGRGTVDMKGGIAAILEAVSDSKLINNVGLLFYCDEEYSFAGMKKFIENLDSKPGLVIVAEPTNLKIANEHRGLVEIDLVVKGKSGHASRPNEGVNAITNAIEAAKQTAKIIGPTTFVISKIKGGTQVGIENGRILYAEGTNIIPDTAEVSIDSRIDNLDLNAEKILKIYQDCLKKLGSETDRENIRANLGSLKTPKTKLKALERVIKKEVGKVQYIPSYDMGYGDGQMIFQKVGCPVVYFGPGPTEMCHKADEYIEVDSLNKTVDIFKKLIGLHF